MACIGLVEPLVGCSLPERRRRPVCDRPTRAFDRRPLPRYRRLPPQPRSGCCPQLAGPGVLATPSTRSCHHDRSPGDATSCPLEYESASAEYRAAKRPARRPLQQPWREFRIVIWPSERALSRQTPHRDLEGMSRHQWRSKSIPSDSRIDEESNCPHCSIPHLAATINLRPTCLGCTAEASAGSRPSGKHETSR